MGAFHTLCGDNRYGAKAGGVDYLAEAENAALERDGTARHLSLWCGVSAQVGVDWKEQKGYRLN